LDSRSKEDENRCTPRTADACNNNNNNNVVDDVAIRDAMVANILQNKDLTVEVKPLRVKPVVLAPRHPESNSLYHGRQLPNQPAGSSVIVSVQPRQELPARVLPPPGRPQVSILCIPFYVHT
jgi:hypothetical protein